MHKLSPKYDTENNQCQTDLFSNRKISSIQYSNSKYLHMITIIIFKLQLNLKGQLRNIFDPWFILNQPHMGP